jgi:hypothetical protein
MEKLKTVHIYAVIEAKVPQMTPIRSLNLGMAGTKIMDNFKLIPEAEVLTWWIQDVVPTTSNYCTCPQCGKIEMVTRDAVVLDGKPLCIHCSAEFQHGDLPRPRTPEDLKAQMRELQSK